MKTYQKNEIKDIFEKDTKNITVSKELKNKTLNTINKCAMPSLYWLKNCAAILIVSSLCLSLYIHKQPHFKKQFTNENVPQSISQKVEKTKDAEIPESFLRSTPSVMRENTAPNDLTKQANDSNNFSQLFQQKKQEQPTNNSLITYDVTSEETSTENSLLSYGSVNQKNSKNSIDEIKIGDTENELLILYPHIEKDGNNYSITINNQTILYEITDGIITNILISNK